MGKCIRNFWRAAPILLLLSLAALAPLHALDADAETRRHARRALLHEAARKYLKLDVGQIEPLEVVKHTTGDFGRADDCVVAIRRGKATAIVVLRGTTPVGCCTFDSTGALSLATRRMAGCTWVLLDESTEDATQRRLLSLRENELAVRQTWTHTATASIGKRFRREHNSELSEQPGNLLLTTTVIDYLDDKPMADSLAETLLQLSPQPDGSLHTRVLRDAPVPVAVRLRHARTLERERLEEAAVLLAREAMARSKDLPAEDARRLDAAALVARLEARAAPVQASTK